MGKLQGQSAFFVPGPPALPGEAHRPIVDFLLRETRGKSVLDIGGGRGAYSLELAKAGYNTVVADINSESLKVAEANGLSTRLLQPGESGSVLGFRMRMSRSRTTFGIFPTKK